MYHNKMGRKKGQKLICCTVMFSFKGGDDYPFEKKYGCKVIEVTGSDLSSEYKELDVFDMLNNRGKLTYFSDTSLWKKA